MELIAARTIALDLMSLHGLPARGWTFAFDNAKRRLGVCKYGTKQITISRFMVGAADEETVRQTMLHEIAHALVGKGAGHGPVWKAKAASIGYTGKRTASNPYVEQQRAAQAARPDLVRDILSGAAVDASTVRLRPGQTGIITAGRHAGMRAVVRSVNVSRYTADVEGVGGMYIPFAQLRPSLGAAILQSHEPAPVRLRPGQSAVITSGKHAGTRLTIVKANRTRYEATEEGSAAVWTVPFGMVAAA